MCVHMNTAGDLALHPDGKGILADSAGRIRRHLHVTGIVQGVGFRPYVWHLAKALNLTGWVRNDAAGVEVLVEGEPEPIEAFTRRLPEEIPPLARVRELTWQDAPATGGHAGFAIVESGAGRAALPTRVHDVCRHACRTRARCSRTSRVSWPAPNA